MNTPEQNFDSLNLILPKAPEPMGVYKPFLQIGNTVYLSGHGTLKSDGTFIVGKVGDNMTIEEGKMAAKQVGLAMLATLKENLGSLNKIKRVVKVLGMVNCIPEFSEHPFVINGCSELFLAIWGEELGVGVRSAVGMSSLPGAIPVEIEAQFMLHD